MTQKAAVKILKMPSSTLSDLRHWIIPCVSDRHKIRALTTAGVDEARKEEKRTLDTVVKNIRNRASGYRNLDSSADMIYLTVSKKHPPRRVFGIQIVYG
ncbi:MAG: hypothetical protein KZQ88_06395 [Candidatus Thiodiazotropha sp. (ex Dulcina madagascariensis)]|nr:hypothetical protein [Candidatus Thiodiazotropha sp. (ex Dulcina madagascariensis)]MCU7928558.1 hypothetical protein [Candidatus Thiodiazotropha sp. (ex Dulcina madagascariensis)]